MANIVVEPRTQQTSSLNLVELHQTMQVVCREAGQMDSIEAVVASKGMPSIGSLQKVVGETDIEKVFRYLLAKMREDLHIDNGLSNDNIRNIAKRLRTDGEIRWWLTIADVTLLCRKITSGEYGKFYGHFSEVEFNECLAKYCRERAELHRLESDKCAVPDGAVLEEIGYKVDEHGRLVVPEAMKGNGPKKPMRYLYDAAGRIAGENPAYWGKVRAEKTEEEMQRINESNQLNVLVCKIMDRDKVGVLEALSMAKDELKKRKETSGQPADPNTETAD